MTKWVSHRSSNAEEMHEQAMWGTTAHRGQLSAREFLSEASTFWTKPSYYKPRDSLESCPGVMCQMSSTRLNWNPGHEDSESHLVSINFSNQHQLKPSSQITSQAWLTAPLLSFLHSWLTLFRNSKTAIGQEVRGLQTPLSILKH